MKSRAFITFIVLLACVNVVRSQSSAFTYQGRLTDNNLPANGNYDLRFALFTSATYGSQVSTNVLRPGLAVSNGLFSVILDFGSGCFNGADRWLEIAARPGSGGVFTVLAPRQYIAAAPYAQAALSALQLQGVPVSANAPAANQVLQYASGQWQPAALPATPGAGSTVQAETAFGQTTAVGTNNAYARADHTHGTPPDPIPGHVANTTAHNGHVVGGDLTGTLGASVVSRLRGASISSTAPTNNQILAYSGGQWLPATLPAIAAPGTVVQAETTFGQGAAAGTNTAYARADHTHGTPTDPIPLHVASTTAHNGHTVSGDVTGTLGASVVSRLRGIPISLTPATNGQILICIAGQWMPTLLPTIAAPGAAVQSGTAFGLAPAVGTGTTYARADHTHGTPPDPIPAHVTNTTAHSGHVLNGDVTGTLGTNVVSRLRGVAIGAAAPAAGQVLAYSGTQWQPATLPTGSSNVVERPAGLPRYVVVAAGIIGADGAVTSPTYNGLKVVSTGVGQINCTFNGYAQPGSTTFQYIVKVMPVYNLSTANAMVSFGSFSASSFSLRVTDGLGNNISGALLSSMDFMVEVSQFFAN